MTRPKRSADRRRTAKTPPRGKVVNAEFPRITAHPRRMGGSACIRDMRVTVTNILELLAAGRSEDEILAEYPYLEREDFRDVLGYAAWCTERRPLQHSA